MSAYFVTASGANIGKTFVTAGLIRQLRPSILRQAQDEVKTKAPT
jgi:dethiobiotin synthetase